jgi:molybdenum cofactor cytidylyltransferase
VSANIIALVLAAGRSTRMGDDNKLLLKFNDKTMVSYVVDQLASSNVDDIYVVTGNEADAVKKSISEKVTFIHNPNYAEGLSTSVKAGIAALPDDIDGVMICLGDMPYITANDYNKLIDAYAPAKIIAPTTNGKIGNPLIFARDYFTNFEELTGDKGARKLLKDYPEQIIEVDLNTEAIFQDIDTPQEYEEV